MVNMSALLGTSCAAFAQVRFGWAILSTKVSSAGALAGCAATTAGAATAGRGAAGSGATGARWGAGGPAHAVARAIGRRAARFMEAPIVALEPGPWQAGCHFGSFITVPAALFVQ
ncbi:hypothetical protein WMF11_00785 [Sorangium sp. So ce295]|uniref:hypothetical protein n=1 Tax=Sorangium sp. So ce295 TaxID=3133295 RepID=UPI003F6400B1